MRVESLAQIYNQGPHLAAYTDEKGQKDLDAEIENRVLRSAETPSTTAVVAVFAELFAFGRTFHARFVCAAFLVRRARKKQSGDLAEL